VVLALALDTGCNEIALQNSHCRSESIPNCHQHQQSVRHLCVLKQAEVEHALQVDVEPFEVVADQNHQMYRLSEPHTDYKHRATQN